MWRERVLGARESRADDEIHTFFRDEARVSNFDFSQMGC